MTEESKKYEGSKTSSSSEDSGAIIVPIIILAFLSWVYTRYRLYVDLFLIVVSILLVVFTLYSIFRLVTNHGVQLGKQDQILLSSVTLLWIPLIFVPFLDILAPIANYAAGGVRMLGIILILVVVISNIICSISIFSLYEKSLKLKKPNWLELKVLNYRWLIIGSMYCFAILGIWAGVGAL